MSKSLGNYIGVTDSPEEMFGKTMSIPDNLIIRYFRLITDLPAAEVDAIEKGLSGDSLHPGETKRRLAKTIIRLYYDEAAADAAEATFNLKHKVGEANGDALAQIAEPFDISAHDLVNGAVRIIDMVVTAGFAASKGEARRLVRQGAVRENGRVVESEDAEVQVEDGMILQVGKRRLGRVNVTDK